MVSSNATLTLTAAGTDLQQFAYTGPSFQPFSQPNSSVQYADQSFDDAFMELSDEFAAENVSSPDSMALLGFSAAKQPVMDQLPPTHPTQRPQSVQ